MDQLLADLNPEQRRAAAHGDAPLLVLAGAGTGKTATLAHRVAALIAKGTPPGRILLLTYTRRAAAEMLRRVEALLAAPGGAPQAAGGRLREQVWGGTFHAMAARLLRLHGRSIGLESAFTILDRADAEDLLNFLRAELGLPGRERRFPLKATCLDIYSRAVNAGEPLQQVLEQRFPWCREFAEPLRELFLAYVDRKAAHSVLDYDDLLLYWRGLLQHAQAGQAVRQRFDHVLVDEYQDTNCLQAEILRLLRPDGLGLTVVGDDAQSIYSFRAATVRNILDFPREYPGSQVVTLEQTYRGHPGLLAAANRVLAEAREAHPKSLWSSRAPAGTPVLLTCADEQEQAEYLIERVLEHRESGLQLRKQAVLFRAAHHSLALEVELGRRNIPFRKYGGLKFLEAAHVKDLLAFLRLAENPRDLPAGMRVLLLLPGIGPRKARELMQDLASAVGDLSAWRSFRPPAASAALWPGLCELLETLTQPEPPPPSAQLHAVRTFYAPLLERVHDHPRARQQDLEQLEGYASRFPDRAGFLAEVLLDPPSFTGELAGPPHLDEDYLILSTVHSAKGLEWDAVYVIHAADGNLPSDMACGSEAEIEEERRLFYVALTRARDWLYVLVPLRYYTHPRSHLDRHGYAQPSRFLSPAVRACFEERAAAGAAGEGWHLGACDQQAGADIRAGIRALWL